MRKILLLAAVLLVIPMAVHAQNMNTIDTIVQTFQTQTAGWEGRLQQFAQNTFAILATIQLFWGMARLALKNADIGEFAAELVNQLLFIGLFYWLLTTTTTWGPAIINSFRQAGSTGGMTLITPGNVFAAGIDIATRIWAQISVWAPGASAGLAICALVVLACFAWIVLTMIVALVESYFVIAGGVLFMAFGASRFTNEVAIGVIRNVFGIGAKLFGLQLVVSVGIGFIQQWQTQFNNITAEGVFIEICQALVLAGITKTIPDMFQRMVGGVSTGNAGALIGAAAALTGAGAMMARASAQLATSVAGAGAVVGAATSLAQSQMAARTAAGTAPSNRMARIASAVGQTGANIVSGIGSDIGARLSGQARFGNAGFRIASNLANQSRDIAGGTP